MPKTFLLGASVAESIGNSLNYTLSRLERVQRQSANIPGAHAASARSHLDAAHDALRSAQDAIRSAELQFLKPADVVIEEVP